MAYTKKPNNSRPSYNQPGQYNPSVPEMATAPYNFVSLPAESLIHPVAQKKDAWSKLEKEDRRKEYVKYVAANGQYTGYIGLTVRTLSPCFIGGEIKDDTRQFFTTALASDGAPVIPGSSIRGMIKNIFKIITCGAMRPGEDFTDRRLYFRTMAGKDKALRKLYTDEMVAPPPPGSKSRKGITKAQAGFLVCHNGDDGKEYSVYPAKFKTVKDIDNIKRYEVRNKPGAETGRNGDCVKWNWYCKDGSGVACFVGEMNTGRRNGKAHYTIHYEPDWKSRIRVPAEVIQAYKDDNNRGGVNILHEKMGKRGRDAANFLKQNGAPSDVQAAFIVPCFFATQKTEEGEVVKHFGFGQYYRIPYKLSVADHVPKGLRDTELPDFADAVFGNMGYWATRVFFEDARIIPDGSVKPESDGYTHLLMAPKPTSFQLYLEQDVRKAEKNHWGMPDVNIRGYKFFWHRLARNNDNLWKETDEKTIAKWKEADDKNGGMKVKPIKPIEAQREFHGKIRFENLSKVELGALCAAVSFAREGHKTAYKIGMGKPIGMGSILLEPTLYIENMDRHYSRLFKGDNDGWMREESEREMKEFVDSFAEYRGKNLSEETAAQLEKALDELAELLDCTGKDASEWLQKTSMMQIGKGDDRFRNRVPLLDAISFAKGRLK